MGVWMCAGQAIQTTCQAAMTLLRKSHAAASGDILQTHPILTTMTSREGSQHFFLYPLVFGLCKQDGD